MSVDYAIEGVGSGLDANITHNLTPMLAEAGVPHWTEQNGRTVRDLLPIYRDALARLVADPKHFRAYDPPNGWGDYDIAVDHMRRMVEAMDEVADLDRNGCPAATLRASG